MLVRATSLLSPLQWWPIPVTSSPFPPSRFFSFISGFKPILELLLQQYNVASNKMEGLSNRNEKLEVAEDEEVDPRIQGELEKLNQSMEAINRQETELEEARQKFRTVLVEATVKLDEMGKKVGKAVDDSKPYWEARRVTRQAQLEAQKATQDFQRATEVLRAAKETIALAEQRLLEDEERQFDSAWQEMLNHATKRVMEAEQTKTRSELLHKDTALKYNAAMNRMKQLEKKLKRAINKSKPYFELKAKYYLQMEELKKNVDELQTKLSSAKGEYKAALKNLEMISDEIHERRRTNMIGPRGRGVGAEGNENSLEDLSSLKTDPDELSMTSEIFDDDNGSEPVSEDSESQSEISLSSCPTSPLDQPNPFPPVTCHPSLELLSPVSDCAAASPILGPRSECSGASSPECDAERGYRVEGVENKDKLTNQQTIDEMALKIQVTQISVKCTQPKQQISGIEICGLAGSPTC